jgi:hypothetical protein
MQIDAEAKAGTDGVERARDLKRETEPDSSAEGDRYSAPRGDTPIMHGEGLSDTPPSPSSPLPIREEDYSGMYT